MDSHASIQRVLILYAHMLDDLRFDELGELFCEDAWWTATWAGSTHTFKSRQNIVSSLREIEPKKPGAVRHCPLPPIIDVDGDEAFCWSDAIMFTIEPQANLVVSVGRYHDIFRRDGGRWRIYRRVFVPSGDPLPSGIRPSPNR